MPVLMFAEGLQIFWFSSTIRIKWPAIVGVFTVVRYPINTVQKVTKLLFIA